MKYNFDKVINRRNTNCEKWNVGENELPMWVADMDFQTAPEIMEDLQKRMEHGIFGYQAMPEEWYGAIQSWWDRRHHFHMEKDWLLFCTGVVPAISSIVRKLTTVGENVLVQTPVYHMFFQSVLKNGRNVLENRLKYDGTSYSVDFEDLEEKLALPQTTMMILCNPQNPGGILWDRGTLERIGELCAKHHVLVISDEIHCDLTDPGTEYVPFASVSEICKNNCITCIAPTKTFNIAGLQTAAVMVPNEFLRSRVSCALDTDGVAGAGVFAVTAAVSAFTKGDEWLDALCAYIFENKRAVAAFLEKELPQIKMVPSPATYLLWLDYSALGEGCKEFAKFLRENTGLYVTEGAQFGEAGEQFLRVNIACPRETVEDALRRLKKGVELFLK